MFLLFGWGHTTEKDFGDVMQSDCDNCDNSVEYFLLKQTSWFEIFFIPIIPYNIKHYLVCPVCERVMELNKRQVQASKDMIKIMKSYTNKEITKKEAEKLISYSMENF